MRPRALSEIGTEPLARRPTGYAEFDRVLGGGLVPGSAVLVGGEPGIGKSTLLLGVADRCAGRAVYVAGEESPVQIAARARRLGLSGDALMVLDSTDTAEIAAALEADPPDVCIVDSVQSLRTPGVDGIPGGPAQVRAAAEKLVPVVRGLRTALLLVGQVTKEGGLAGPRLLEHTVDTVIFFEGERQLSVRALRVVKNRFGAADEIGLFEMRDDGLHEVPDASQLLLGDRGEARPGSVVACVVEGRRALCVEVQALLVGEDKHSARRRAHGIDARRAELLVGVVESHHAPGLAKRDVFLNIVGGLSLRDTGVDLAVAVAVVGAHHDVVIGPETAVIGEVGLRSEVRPVPRMATRLKEAKAMGFERAVVPRGTTEANIKGIQLVEVGQVMDVLAAVGAPYVATAPPPSLGAGEGCGGTADRP